MEIAAAGTEGAEALCMIGGRRTARVNLRAGWALVVFGAASADRLRCLYDGWSGTLQLESARLSVDRMFDRNEKEGLCAYIQPEENPSSLAPAA